MAEKLGLAVEPISTQVIPRDRHAAFFAALGVIASSIENLATEVRHLQRTEVREAEEYFHPGQKGSSARAIPESWWRAELKAAYPGDDESPHPEGKETP